MNFYRQILRPQGYLLQYSKLRLIISFILLICGGSALAQYTPIAVTGFNQDVVAETGTSSLTTTTMALDADPASNRVMYTNTFRVTNGFGGGGLPDNGLITSGSDNYQLAAYNASNALLLQRTQSGTLTLSTPARYRNIRVLAFTTEGTSLVNIVLHFTDGFTTNVLTNYALSDWFNATSNLVLSGYGRCTRSTPAGSADGYPTNPRMYYIDIPLSCNDRLKFLDYISFTNVTTAGSNAPYPNSVFMAVSGIINNPSISATVTHATCTANGTATLSITGIATPYTVTWVNTVPLQTGPTATNLPPGYYLPTVTDPAGCNTVYPLTINLVNNLFINTHIDTFVCAGSSFSAGGSSNATNFSWNPTTGVSNPNILSPIITPTGNTTYTVTGTTGPCSVSASFKVFFLEKAVADFDITVHPCTNDPVAFTDRSSVTGGIINQWRWTENGALISTLQSPSLPFGEGPYRVGLVVTGNVGCTSDTTFKTFTVTGKPLIDMQYGDICKNDIATFIASELNSTGVTQWRWFFDDATTASGSIVNHTYNNGGSLPVKLVGESAAGCISDTLIRYINIYSTAANAGRDTITASGVPVQLQGSGGVSYSWTPIQYLSNPNTAHPVATVFRDQQFVLRAYTPIGCDTYDTMWVKVSDVPEIYLPGAFTPDGRNPVYHALPVGIKEFRFLRIYNRYGQEVFATTDYHRGWDGTLQGKKQGNGVYVAIAAGVDYRGNLIERQTSFLLIR